ncbi:SigE family RNA polymerase sigma factor [Arsenicicoccus dermatophilus]|uniref:SigE family RNA polymerase sigma factor n=1 Tax=Arsenicicoccus dermatophilus TaxID=1076331 RepID=UPI001F4C8D49|nr:SigE family RNA polymerase sigma factor [Arsenicicoccus dermatophilus]MCH8613655.1 SigE family RNA polymerase sigma factor [Arsenicicoccus dermatophilus]
MLRSRRERDQAFTRFVQEATPSLTRTAWLLTGSRDDAVDLVQAAFVKTYASWSRVRDDDALAYTRRVLANEHVDRWRRRHGEVAVAEVHDRPGRGDTTVDDRDEVVRLLATLPAQQRTVVVLRYYNDLSEAAVAEHLGISVGSVKSAASRGLAALRTAYADNASHPPLVASPSSTPAGGVS